MERARVFTGQMQEHARVQKTVLAFAATLPICTCCREFRDVTSDPVGGAQLCPVCMFQVVRCGRCAMHGSRVFYQQLTAGPVLDVPEELLRAYGLKPAEEPAALTEAPKNAFGD